MGVKKMKHLILCFVALSMADGNQNDQRNVPKALATIANRNSSEAEWSNALNELDKPPEPPKFWIDIANDSKCPIDRRRQAIFKLFERHIPPRIKLSRLSELLGGAKWVQDSDVTADWGPGVRPLDITGKSGKGRLYSIAILPRPHEDDSSWIEIRIAKKVEPRDLSKVLRGGKIPPQVGELTMEEYALCRTGKDSFDVSEFIRSAEPFGGETTRRLILKNGP
jgi:hypothetical protein